jgi:nucleoside phosphorylase
MEERITPFRPYYLFFFDRELLTSLGMYGISESDVFRDALMSVLSTPMQCYFACSLLFESGYARRFFWRYVPLFTEGKAFVTISGPGALTPWIRGKQYQYRMDDRSRYANYFSDYGKLVEDKNPHMVRRPHSTTRILHSRMLNTLSDVRLPSLLPLVGGEHLHAEMGRLAPWLSEAIEMRAGRAVTKKLFQPIYKRKAVPSDIIQAFNLTVSLEYVASHLDEWSGTVPVNGRVPIRLFDHLSVNRPISDLSVWETAYKLLGVYDRLIGLSGAKIALLKDMPEFSKVLHLIAGFLLDEPLAMHDPQFPRFPPPRAKSDLAWIEGRFRQLVRSDWPGVRSASGLLPNTGGRRMRRTQEGVDVLLIVAKTIEANAMLAAAQAITGIPRQTEHVGRKTYSHLGRIGGAAVAMVRTAAGTTAPGAALSTTLRAAVDVSPGCVILAGIAFGIDPRKQAIGNILVSRQVQPYQIMRIGTDDGGGLKVTPRGDRATASSRLLDRFEDAELDWRKTSVDFGLILSGDILVDNPDFKRALVGMAPEALGGEMEGAGVYTAAHDENVEWIIVKAICDWADGLKKDDEIHHQQQAARNAAEFVLASIERGGFAVTR